MGKGVLIAILITFGIIAFPFIGILFWLLSPVMIILVPIILPIVIIGVVIGYCCKKEKKSK